MVHDNSLYNEDELQAPDWMNEVFLQKVLEERECGARVKIVNFKVTPATTKCDHYASIMFRVQVTYTLSDADNSEPKCQLMIIKAAPETGGKADLIEKSQPFETEIKMYSEILPKIEAALSKHGDDTKLSARLIYQTLQPRKCIIFEDLVEKGYKVVSRSFTMEEVKEALLKLAKLHAISYKMAQEGDVAVIAMEHGPFCTKGIKELDFIRYAIRLFKEVVGQHSDLKKYLAFIEKIEDGIIDKCIALCNRYKTSPNDGIYVLNHGDFHMKNMMLRHDAKAVQDLMLVDYQICLFTSPAIDLLYAFTMLLSPDMRRNHRDELFYFYFTNFQNTLKLVEYNGHIPTMFEFQLELLKYKDWELFIFMSFLPFNHVLSDPDGDLTATVENENYRRRILQSPEVLNEIRTMLPLYLHGGYFES